MTEFLKGLMLTVLSETCYNEYFTKYNFLDVPCFKATLSKGLGIGIIAGSILVKVPQIVKILNSKSAKGINVYGVYLELFAITANFTYSYVMGFPFSAWGEGTFLAIQTAIIAALVLHYGKASAKAAIFLATYIGIVSALIGGYTPTDVLWTMQAINVPIILSAKFIGLTIWPESHLMFFLHTYADIVQNGGYTKGGQTKKPYHQAIVLSLCLLLQKAQAHCIYSKSHSLSQCPYALPLRNH